MVSKAGLGGHDGEIAVVHNGVIDNWAGLKTHLKGLGYPFKSETDTEVVAHLIAHHFEGDLVAAIRKVLPLLKGTYGLAVVSKRDPNLIGEDVARTNGY